MKKISFLLSFILITHLCQSQDMTKFKLYKPGEKAEESIAASIKLAKQQGKHVFIQIGGNWCVWCARFNDFTTSDKSIDSLIHSNFVVYHLNYSKENTNKDLLAKYRFPQRFGFPVFLVLDGDGNLLHTQSSWYLEKEKSYDKEKVLTFFQDWSPKALDPAQYKEQ